MTQLTDRTIDLQFVHVSKEGLRYETSVILSVGSMYDRKMGIQAMLLGLFKNVRRVRVESSKSSAFSEDPTRVRRHVWRVRAT